MVLAVMVAILMFRVYQVLNPPPPPEGALLTPPGPGPLEGGPGIPPSPPPPELTDDWSRLWRRNIWTYIPETGGTRTGENPNGPEQLDISLVDLREVNGTWRARIKTASRTTWYQADEAFEQYTLMQIDPERGCVTIFSDRAQRNIELCKEQQ